MSDKPLILLASARKQSDTTKLVQKLFAPHEADMVDLLNYTVCHYSYTGEYPSEDQFMELVTRMQTYDRIVFATPVYWYAMSGHMKVFFDRLTDIVTLHKGIGRSMKGKSTFVLAVGVDDALPAGFDVPFKLTSLYLDMHFKELYYRKNSEIDVIDKEAAAFKQLVCAKMNVR